MDFMNYTYQKNQSNFYSAPTLGKRERMARRDHFTLKDLSDAELQQIFNLHGAMVEDVLPLTESQQWIFSNDMIISENFYIQALFKVTGNIRPHIVNERVEWLVKNHPILRTVFFCGDGQRNLQVVLKIRTAEIRFHDIVNKSKDEINQTLENIMTADRRRGFDLAKDRLVRIGVFRTGLKEYAVLIAQPQLVADNWDFGQLFTDLFVDEESNGIVAKQLKGRNFSFAEYLKKRGEQDKAPAIVYWKNLLQNLHEVSKVPGGDPSTVPYQQAVSGMMIDKLLILQLKFLAGNNTGLMALFQTAWGVILQHYNRSNDAIYGTILSNRTARLDNIEETAAIVNVMPIRVTCPIDMKFTDLCKKQQMQLVLSQPYSYCTPQDFQEISGLKTPLFNHFLNFHGFGMKESYTGIEAPFGVTPVCINSFDSHNADFGIYFRMMQSSIYMEFVYHQAVFNKNKILLLQQAFLAILRQVSNNPQIQICEIKLPSLAQFEEASLDAKAMREEMRSFIKTIALFSDLPDVIIDELLARAKMEYFVEDDVICVEGAKQENFYVIYSGNVEISRSASDGWSGSLKLLKRGSVFGYEGILNQRPSSVRVEALLGDVKVIAIPNSEMAILMRKNFDFVVNVISELNNQINKFQKLWVSSN